jgi:YgiT-type zinc finger domain-containing protein
VDQLAGEEEAGMIPFKECPVCGGEMVEKEVKKLLRGGRHTAIMRVHAEVCTKLVRFVADAALTELEAVEKEGA